MTWFRKTCIRVKSAIGKRYKWVALVGTLLISASFSLKDRANEESRRFTDAYENTTRFIKLRELTETAAQPHIKAEKPKDDDEGQLRMATAYLAQSGEYIKRYDDLRSIEIDRDFDKQEDALNRELAEIEKRVNSFVFDTNTSKDNARHAAIQKAYEDSEALLKETYQFDDSVEVFLQMKRSELEIHAQIVNAWSYTILGFGIWVALWAQSLGKMGEPPELPV